MSVGKDSDRSFFLQASAAMALRNKYTISMTERITRTITVMTTRKDKIRDGINANAKVLTAQMIKDHLKVCHRDAHWSDKSRSTEWKVSV